LQESEISNFTKVLSLGVTYACALRYFVEAGGGANEALDFILSESEHNIGIFVSMGAIYDDKIPAVLIESLARVLKFLSF